MVTIYGIKNCDSVKKARIWLEQHGIAYTFHDFRSDGLDESMLRQWAGRVGWEQLLNRRGRSWKELSENDRSSIDEGNALRLMLDNPTLIKRPVVSYHDQIQVGFSDEEFTSLFGQ